MEILPQILLNSIIAGSIYALVALGFSLIYGTARFFDLGYGALTAIGAYATFFLYKRLDLDIFTSILGAILIAGLCGLLIERLIYRPLRTRKSSSTVFLVASLGILTVIQAVIAMLFSSQFQILSRNISGQQTYNILGVIITETQTLILFASLTIMLCLGLVLKYTRFGKAVRAVSDDIEVAEIVGINSKQVLSAVFFTGAAIAGLSGIAVGFDTGIEPAMGMPLHLKGVVACIIGGIGNIYGAVIGAFLLALIENLGAWHFSGEWKDAIAFGILILMLLIRPQGLLPRK